MISAPSGIHARSSVRVAYATKTTAPLEPRVNSRDVEHPLEGHSGPFGSSGIDLDLVDHGARYEAFEHPREVRCVDAEHGRAGAHERVERHDRLVRILPGHALHHMDLGGDPEGSARRCGLDPLEDAFGRTDPIGNLDDIMRALGMDD